MTRCVNKVILVGNLTRNPERKETNGGQQMTTFGLATNREWTVNGEKRSETQFHEIVAWSKLGEICYKYLQKGKLVYVEGHLNTITWTDEHDNKRFRTEVVINDMVILNKRSEENPNYSELDQDLDY